MKSVPTASSGGSAKSCTIAKSHRCSLKDHSFLSALPVCFLAGGTNLTAVCRHLCKLMADLASKDSSGSTLPVSTGADDLASEPSDAFQNLADSPARRPDSKTSLGNPHQPTAPVPAGGRQQRQHQQGSLLTSNFKDVNLPNVRTAATPDLLIGLDAFKKSLPPVRTPRRNSEDHTSRASLSLSRVYTPTAVQRPTPSIPEDAAASLALQHTSGTCFWLPFCSLVGCSLPCS